MNDTNDLHAKEELLETLNNLAVTMQDLLRQSNKTSDKKMLESLRTELKTQDAQK